MVEKVVALFLSEPGNPWENKIERVRLPHELHWLTYRVFEFDEVIGNGVDDESHESLHQRERDLVLGPFGVSGNID